MRSNSKCFFKRKNSCTSRNDYVGLESWVLLYFLVVKLIWLSEWSFFLGEHWASADDDEQWADDDYEETHGYEMKNGLWLKNKSLNYVWRR